MEILYILKDKITGEYLGNAKGIFKTNDERELDWQFRQSLEREDYDVIELTTDEYKELNRVFKKVKKQSEQV